MNLLGALTSRWSMLPLAGRGLIVVLFVALIYFAFTSSAWSGSSGSSKSASSPAAKAWGETQVGAAIVEQVREAAQSAKRAGTAKSPTEQLLHIQWGLAKLKSARAIAKAERGADDEAEIDALLSVSSGLHIGRLGSYLDRAQALCVERLEKAAGAAASSSSKE